MNQANQAVLGFIYSVCLGLLSVGCDRNPLVQTVPTASPEYGLSDEPAGSGAPR